MKFADRFSELVSNRGDVARLSEATGMNDSILSKYKRGITEPTLPQAVVIANYFDVSLDWLAGRDGYERDSHKNQYSPSLADDEQKLVDSYRATNDYFKPEISDYAARQAERHPKKQGDGGSGDVMEAV